MSEMTAELIAPCGMNCRLCYAYIREKKPCSGCRGDDAHKPNSCVACTIKNCEILSRSGAENCSGCEKMCRRLKQLDKRYREKYHMSMLENLAYITAHGMSAFLDWEESRWRCKSCGAVLCVHRKDCHVCGAPIPSGSAVQEC